MYEDDESEEELEEAIMNAGLESSFIQGPWDLDIDRILWEQKQKARLGENNLTSGTHTSRSNPR